MTASAPVAPPRWPADAALLREVLAWARAEGWRPAPNRAHPAYDAVPIIGSWTRGPAGEYGLGDEYVCFVHDLGEISDDVSGPGMFGDMCDGVPLASVEQGVDLLVALKVLPTRFHAAFRSLRDRASDPAVVTAVAAGLGPLVDKGAATRQAERAIAVVLDALEVPGA